MRKKEEQAEGGEHLAIVVDVSAKLSVAARAGNAASLARIISQMDAKTAAGDASDAIEQAAKNGHLACVKILAGRSPSDKAINLAMARAAASGHLECVEFLLPMADPCFESSMALRHAAENGRTDCVGLLAPKSCVGALNSYALRWAARMGHAECVKMLLSGSDPLAEECYAIRYAARDGHADCIKELLVAGEEQASDGTALRWAARAGSVECARLLAPCSGAWWEDMQGALRLAAERGKTSCVSALLEELGHRGQSGPLDDFLLDLSKLAAMMRAEGSIMQKSGQLASAEAMESFVEAASLAAAISIERGAAKRHSL